jgi:hypothetical protein
MDRSALETRITAAFIDRLQTNDAISADFPDILRDGMDESSFGSDETVIDAVIEAHEE